MSSEVTIDREKLKCYVAAQKIEEMAELIYTKLDTSSIRMVTLCKNCKHYRKFKNKKTRQVKYLCELDKLHKDPDFYCAKGEEED